MTRDGKPFVWIAVVLGVLVVMGGCKKKHTLPPIDENALVGKWIEVPITKVANPRMAAPPPSKYLRYIEINADHTFVFSLRDKSGKPAGKGKAEGTWKANNKEHIIEYNVTSSTFKGKDQSAWVPATGTPVAKMNLKDLGEVEATIITDVGDEPHTYVHAQ